MSSPQNNGFSGGSILGALLWLIGALLVLVLTIVFTLLLIPKDKHRH